ncbi:MAG: AAA family ATPase [Clostridia bacterium]|nr:AAA family ATPase [Clostridia bacterium]
MAQHIAVAGKGGTGKTTFVALLTRYLLEREKGTVLAVDADPNANLNEALGLTVTSYISDILEETKNPKAIPPGMSKDIFIDYRMSQALVEHDHLDLLVMGNPQGPGCYCYPSDLLRKQIEGLTGNYDYLVVDNEAGLEHISRGILPKVQHLFVISDSSARGIRSAGRVHQLVKSLGNKVENIYLIVTRVGEEGIGALQEEIEKTELPLIGTIPLDPLVVSYDTEGKPLFELPDDSVALKAVYGILQKANL